MCGYTVCPQEFFNRNSYSVVGRDNSSMMRFSSRSEFGQGLEKLVGGCCESCSSKQQTVVKSCKQQIPELLVSTLYLTIALLICSASSVRAQTSVDQGERFESIRIWYPTHLLVRWFFPQPFKFIWRLLPCDIWIQDHEHQFRASFLISSAAQVSLKFCILVLKRCFINATCRNSSEELSQSLGRQIH